MRDFVSKKVDSDAKHDMLPKHLTHTHTESVLSSKHEEAFVGTWC